MYHFNRDGGLDFGDVQLTSNQSPTLYPRSLAPVIIGRSSGKSITWKKKLICDRYINLILLFEGKKSSFSYFWNSTHVCSIVVL